MLDANDIAGLSGLSSIAYGLHLIYDPAMFIVVGLSLVTLSILRARNK